MATLHCVITKQFTFRGKPERFSNGYNLQTTSDLTEAFVKSVCDALRDMERAFHRTEVSFVYANGGPIGSDAVYAEEYGTPLAGSNTTQSLGGHPENCYMAESKIGPKKYLRKYYHTLVTPSAPGSDVVSSSAKSTMETALVKLTNGTLPGSATYCRPNGAIATAPFTIDPFIRTHQLKRRGKRP